jgi:hypothetical protein
MTDPRNDGSTDDPQVRHTMHASVTQADAIGGPLTKADALTCLNDGLHAAEPEIALEAKTGAVEHTGSEGASPSRGDGDGKGRMKTLQETIKGSVQECRRKREYAPVYTITTAVSLSLSTSTASRPSL